MRQHRWWGCAAGGVSGLTMLACALVLAAHGEHACLQPFVSLALQGPAGASADADLTTLAPGVLFHEAVAAILGLLGVRVLSAWCLPHAVPLLIAGGGLSLEVVDRAVLAWRVPEMPVMLTGAQALPYLAFGVVLAATVPRSYAARSRSAGGRSRPPVAASSPLPSGAVLDRRTLRVLIAPHCFGCERAQQLAAAAQARFPGLVVLVVDLEQFAATLPPGVVAVPAYILDGRLLFTGNPTAEALYRALIGAGVAGDAPDGA